MRPCLRRLVAALAGPCVALGGGIAAAQGTIRYVQPAEPIYATQGRFQMNWGLRVPLDLDGDGLAEYEFSGDLLSVSVQGRGDNHQLALLAIPPDLGSYLYPLGAGTAIGPTPPSGLHWVDYTTPRHPVPGQSGVSAYSFNGGSGPFFGVMAYMGVYFELADGMHYGWVRIDAPSYEAGGVILDWAYEMRPGEAILAGAVPEPSAWALLLTGCFLFWWYGRKKRMA